MPSFRILPYETADGPHHMAADEVLLESAVGGVASLRFYGWTKPTLSLGYFQPASARMLDPRWADLPFVRRPTGGLTLVHHLEVTYALGLPAGLPWHTDESWLCKMHGIIASALLGLGIDLLVLPLSQQRERGGGRGRAESPESISLCFLQPSAGDLMIGSAKVVGSSQRKQRAALLQHGAVLLAASPYTPELPGILELTGRALTPEEIGERICDQFARTLAAQWVRSSLTEEEHGRIEELRCNKYSQDAWNRKR